MTNFLAYWFGKGFLFIVAVAVLFGLYMAGRCLGIGIDQDVPDASSSSSSLQFMWDLHKP